MNLPRHLEPAAAIPLFGADTDAVFTLLFAVPTLLSPGKVFAAENSKRIAATRNVTGARLSSRQRYR